MLVSFGTQTQSTLPHVDCNCAAGYLTVAICPLSMYTSAVKQLVVSILHAICHFEYCLSLIKAFPTGNLEAIMNSKDCIIISELHKTE